MTRADIAMNSGMQETPIAILCSFLKRTGLVPLLVPLMMLWAQSRPQ